MGGEAKLAERRAPGSLNARERVGLLIDAGSWQETGLFDLILGENTRRVYKIPSPPVTDRKSEP